MNNYVSLSLWAGWIVSVLLVVFFSLMGAREFKEESTIKVDKPLTKQDIYYFSEKDIRVIEASTLENGQKKYKIEVEGEELSAYLRRDISIRFEYLNTGETPYIQYNYSAKGKSYQAATRRASDINYVASQDSNRIVFASHFNLGKNNDFRDQSVSVVVYLPVGSKVVLDNNLSGKLSRMGYYDCKNQYAEERVKYTEWVMKKSGLSCAPSFEVITESVDIQDKIDEQLEKHEKKLQEELDKLEKNLDLKNGEMEKKLNNI